MKTWIKKKINSHQNKSTKIAKRDQKKKKTEIALRKFICFEM